MFRAPSDYAAGLCDSRVVQLTACRRLAVVRGPDFGFVVSDGRSLRCLRDSFPLRLEWED